MALKLDFSKLVSSTPEEDEANRKAFEQQGKDREAAEREAKIKHSFRGHVIGEIEFRHDRSGEAQMHMRVRDTSDKLVSVIAALPGGHDAIAQMEGDPKLEKNLYHPDKERDHQVVGAAVEVHGYWRPYGKTETGKPAGFSFMSMRTEFPDVAERADPSVPKTAPEMLVSKSDTHRASNSAALLSELIEVDAPNAPATIDNLSVQFRKVMTLDSEDAVGSALSRLPDMRLPSVYAIGDYYNPSPAGTPEDTKLVERALAGLTPDRVISTDQLPAFQQQMADVLLEHTQGALQMASQGVVQAEAREATIRAVPLQGLDIPSGKMVILDMTAGPIFPDEYTGIAQGLVAANTKHVRIFDRPENVGYSKILGEMLQHDVFVAGGDGKGLDVSPLNSMTLAKLLPEAQTRAIDYVEQGKAHVIGRTETDAKQHLVEGMHAALLDIPHAQKMRTKSLDGDAR